MAVQEITKETEFLKGWNSVDEDKPKAEVKPEEKAEVKEHAVADEVKPVEEKAETKEVSATEKTVDEEKKPEDVQPVEEKKETKEPDKAETSKATKIVESEETYKQRWKSQEGIVKSEMTKRKAAEDKAKELEAELARLKALANQPAQATAEAAKPDEIDELEEKYLDAVDALDRAGAIKIRKQIDDMKYKRFLEEAKKTAVTEATTSITHQQLQSEVDKIVSANIEKYPFLDHTDETKGNPYAIRLVIATRDDYIKQGMGFIEALQAAVDEVVPMFQPKEEVKPEVKEEKKIDEEKIKSTVAVETKNTPIRVGGKTKKLETFEDGWNSA